MEFIGIIAEYDPFHNGHAWQLEQARALGAERVAVAMSCGLTQRGELPLLPESVRVRAALTCGADIVFALPAPYACSGAESFARAGVRLLAAAGCTALAFGAETPDIALLMKAARVLLSEEYRAALRERLADGARSFAAARQEAAGAVCGDEMIYNLLNQPNNNLAVEYCKAILEQNAPMRPVALPRQGAGHGEALGEAGGRFASASALRGLWQTGAESESRFYVPEAVHDFYGSAIADGNYTNFEKAHLAELALLRAACAREDKPFANIRGVSEGLEHRLEAAVRGAASYEELLYLLTTVRYPRARMRRLAMDAALGWEAGSLPALPPYLHVLGAKREALPLLKTAALPASHSLAKLERQSAACAECVKAQAAADNFGALCLARPAPMGGSYRQKPVFLPEC